jgi:hypothetical protein
LSGSLPSLASSLMNPVTRSPSLNPTITHY